MLWLTEGYSLLGGHILRMKCLEFYSGLGGEHGLLRQLLPALGSDRVCCLHRNALCIETELPVC